MINLRMILEKAPEGATHYTDVTPSLNVYVKVVHLDGCYLHLAGKWERYPSYAGLKCLEDLRVMLESQAERDALAATVEALKDSINKCTVDGVALLRLSPELKQAVAATPQQHLAERDAQKGRDGYIAARLSWMGIKNPEGITFPDADRYADGIRQESK